MTALRTNCSMLTGLAVSFLLLNLILKFAFLTHLSGLAQFSAIRDNLVDPSWDVERKHVLLPFDKWLRYELHDSEQWSALFPGEGLVYLGEDHHPQMVSMLHQLRCIDILREQLSLPLPVRPEQPARHCMNYLRQMLLCRGDIYLDPYQYASRIKAVNPNPVRRCLDWEAVYKAVEANQRDHGVWVAGQPNVEVTL
ncbi:hypothetical protein BU15DRAFT_87622 [Melanogaster broomeanus]|nr:hypothetical protein BU15DRAFT_87622 [Melanogaster broomeanus]